MVLRNETKQAVTPEEIREFADAIFIVLGAYAGSMSHSVASVIWAVEVVSTALEEVHDGVSKRIS